MTLTSNINMKIVTLSEKFTFFDSKNVSENRQYILIKINIIVINANVIGISFSLFHNFNFLNIDIL